MLVLFSTLFVKGVYLNLTDWCAYVGSRLFFLALIHCIDDVLTAEPADTIQIDEKLEGAEHTKTVLHELYHVFQHLHNIPRCEMCARMSEQHNLDRFKKTL